jgi:hypothetical protein
LVEGLLGPQQGITQPAGMAGQGEPGLDRAHAAAAELLVALDWQAVGGKRGRPHDRDTGQPGQDLARALGQQPGQLGLDRGDEPPRL